MCVDFIFDTKGFQLCDTSACHVFECQMGVEVFEYRQINRHFVSYQEQEGVAATLWGI